VTEVLSPRAFGAALGVTRQAVQWAIKTGRLKDAVGKDERTGYWRIDLEKGRDEWEAWTNPDNRPKGRKKPSGRPPVAASATPSLFETAEDKDRKKELVTHARASTERVQLDAELKRFELETLRGNLVDRREVQKEAFRLARLVRDRLQAVPDRLAASLAALDKPAQVHEVLASEIAQALQALDRREDEP
jgi:hypothetical protein